MLKGKTIPYLSLESQNLVKYFQDGFYQHRIDPHKIALRYQDVQLTFQNLDQISTKISLWLSQNLTAHYGPDWRLQSKNPENDLVVALCLPPSDKLILVLFALLKLNLVYLPIDVTTPLNRICHIVNVAHPILVLVEPENVQLQQEKEQLPPVLILPAPNNFWWEKDIDPEPENLKLTRQLDGTATAIILFTSGSSGIPKGVRLSHVSILNRLNWQWSQFPFENENCCLKTSLTFVDSLAEIFGSLLMGQTLTIFSQNVVKMPHIFAQKIFDYKIDRLVVIPSFLGALISTMEIIEKDKDSTLTSRALDGISLWVCSGETLTVDLISKFFNYFSKSNRKRTLCNFYGSTEVMGDVTFETFDNLEDIQTKCWQNRVPLGQPISNTTILILNFNMEVEQRESQIGEICVQSLNLATGYVGQQFSDKFVIKDKQRLYKTGDFGFIKKVGGKPNLFFMGRVDSIVKVRGHRIDLSEIESHLNDLQLVKKCLVLCHHAGELEQTLLAFVVTSEINNNFENWRDSREIVRLIKQELKLKLNEYQIPLIQIVSHFPLLVNGKVDRQGLLQEYDRDLLNGSTIQLNIKDLNVGVGEEENSKLKFLKSLFETVSKFTGICINKIDLNSSFFDLGGTSLNAVAVIAKLRKMNYDISIPDFVCATSLRSLYDVIKNQNGGKSLDQIKIETLNDNHKEEAINLISTAFSQKGDLDRLVKLGYDEYVNEMRSVWNDLVEQGYSFVVKRSSDQTILGVAINYDKYRPLPDSEYSPESQIIMYFLAHIETPHLSKLPSGKGKIFYNYLLATDLKLTAAESIYLFHLMEEENERLGQQGQFCGILSHNTSVLTQQLSRHVQGYTELENIQINKYKNPIDGSRPFAHAPDSQIVTLCWKAFEGNSN